MSPARMFVATRASSPCEQHVRVYLAQGLVDIQQDLLALPNPERHQLETLSKSRLSVCYGLVQVQALLSGPSVQIGGSEQVPPLLV